VGAIYVTVGVIAILALVALTLVVVPGLAVVGVLLALVAAVAVLGLWIAGLATRREPPPDPTHAPHRAEASDRPPTPAA
jgi:hypothetical protein